MVKLDRQTLVVRTENLRSTTVDGELVILHLANSIYVGLDDIGGRIWTLLENPNSIAALCDKVSEEYAGDPIQIAHDVLEFIRELRSHDLIQIK
jgi:Coenzyme PQQ synthesis protein D (PqqD)